MLICLDSGLTDVSRHLLSPDSISANVSIKAIDTKMWTAIPSTILFASNLRGLDVTDRYQCIVDCQLAFLGAAIWLGMRRVETENVTMVLSLILNHTGKAPDTALGRLRIKFISALSMLIIPLQKVQLRLKVCHCGYAALMVPSRAPIRVGTVCALENCIPTGIMS